MTKDEKIKHMQEVIEHKESVIITLIKIKKELIESLNHTCNKVNELKENIKELEREIYVGKPRD
tara:strand:+ start:961 stop:1152 length:192 start_codon:yes stop_codon:yes gene_type:complete